MTSGRLPQLVLSTFIYSYSQDLSSYSTEHDLANDVVSYAVPNLFETWLRPDILGMLVQVHTHVHAHACV